MFFFFSIYSFTEMFFRTITRGRNPILYFILFYDDLTLIFYILFYSETRRVYATFSKMTPEQVILIERFFFSRIFKRLAAGLLRKFRGP